MSVEGVTKRSRNWSLRNEPARNWKSSEWKQQLPNEMETGSSPFELNPDKNGAIYINIQGLFTQTKKNKVLYLIYLAKESNSPFIVVTETWLTENILDAEIRIPGYILYRSDRANGRSHGGSCLYVCSNLTNQMILSHSNGTCDSLVIKIMNLETIIVCIYRPPDTNFEEFKETLETVQATIDEVAKTDNRCKTILQGPPSQC